MSDASKNKVTVFFAWQSDVSEKCNRYAIRDALHAMSSALSLELNIEVEIDQATRDMVGSENIPAKIQEKIRNADIFVGDITTINGKATDANRRTPNPNVTFELGYAVAYLGWPRIVLLMNKHFGKVTDAPFDFDRHRIASFTFTEDPSLKKKHVNELQALCTTAIGKIISKNPPKQYELREKTDVEIKRAKDVENLTRAIEWIHWPTLQEWVSTGPKYMSGRVLYLYEEFRSVVTSPMFHLFDPILAKNMSDLYEAWTESVHSESYDDPTGSGLKYVFRIPMDLFRDKQQKDDYERLEAALDRLEAATKATLAHIRQHYLDVDLDAANAHAFNAAKKHRQEIERETKKSDREVRELKRREKSGKTRGKN